MTEDEARDYLTSRFGSARLAALEKLVAAVLDEATRQNLIAPSTVAHIWARHVADSAQLIDLAPSTTSNWLDIGTGAGFPGLAVAVLVDLPVVMLEPRRRRAAFLTQAAADLGSRGQIMAMSVQSHRQRYEVISARAVAPLPSLLGDAMHCSTWNTKWLLPKGSTAREEVAAAEKRWQGVFHVEPSISSNDGLIVTAQQVRAR